MSGSLASVSFSQIPPNLRIPLVALEFDNSQAGGVQPNQDTLLIGPALTTMPQVPVLVTSVAQAVSLFGASSVLALMFAGYFLNDSLQRIWCLPVAQFAGGAAKGAIAVTGTATAAGQLSAYVAGALEAPAVAVGDTAAVIAGNLAAVINADPICPVSAIVSGGTVTVTADQIGALGNGIDLRLNYVGLPGGQSLPAGLTVAVTPMSGGSGEPLLTTLDAILGDQPFAFIVSAYGDLPANSNLGVLLNNATGRWAPTRLTYGHAWTAYSDPDVSNATITSNLQAFGSEVNGSHVNTFGYGNSPTWSCVAAAMIAGACAASIRADPAQPVQTLQVQGFAAPPPASRLTKLQQQVLLTSGIACLTYDQAGNTYILRAVTNYQENVYGQADNSYLDTETLYTLVAISQQLTSALSSKFGRCKLADDGTRFGQGQPVVTPTIVKAELAAQYSAMETAGLVEDADAMIASTVVVRNAQDPSRLDILWTPYLISGLRIIAIKNQFHLLSALAA